MADTDPFAEIKARAAAATPGPWKASTDICDCGGEYACGHGSFVDGIVLPVSHRERPDGKYETWDFTYSEIIEFSDETRDFLVHSKSDVDWLIAEVERLRAELAAQGAHTHTANCLCVMVPMDVEGASECHYCGPYGAYGKPCGDRCDIARAEVTARG